MDKNSLIFVSGHQGMIGQSLLRLLNHHGFYNVLTRSKNDLNLLNQSDVINFFEENKPDYVFIASGKTGGIYANANYRAEFIYENIQMQTNLIHASHIVRVKKLIFIACSSMFPANFTFPFVEEDILTGKPEWTNEPLAIAKIAGTTMCQAYNHQYGSDFIVAIPTNVYGPGDKFDIYDSTVIPAIFSRMYRAHLHNEDLEIWGGGEARRDFLYVDDLSRALILMMSSALKYDIYNVGTGTEICISQIVNSIKDLLNYKGKIIYSSNHLEGVKSKLQNIDRIKDLGWRAEVCIDDGLKLTKKYFDELSLYASL